MKYHTLKLEIPEALQKYDQTEVTISVSAMVTLSDLIAAFERFVIATGYELPEKTHIDIVETE